MGSSNSRSFGLVASDQSGHAAWSTWNRVGGEVADHVVQPRQLACQLAAGEQDRFGDVAGLDAEFLVSHADAIGQQGSVVGGHGDACFRFS